MFKVGRNYVKKRCSEMKPKEIFFLDVNSGVILAFLPAVLHIFGNYYFTMFTYLCGSLIMFLIYNYPLKIYNFSKKIK